MEHTGKNSGCSPHEHCHAFAQFPSSGISMSTLKALASGPSATTCSGRRSCTALRSRFAGEPAPSVRSICTESSGRPGDRVGDRCIALAVTCLKSDDDGDGGSDDWSCNLQRCGREQHTWTASSRVGVSTRTYVALMRRDRNRSRSNRGSTNAAVLPEPEQQCPLGDGCQQAQIKRAQRKSGALLYRFRHNASKQWTFHSRTCYRQIT